MLENLPPGPSTFEREIAHLSATLASLPADEMDAHIERALGRVAEFFDLDRVTVAQRLEDETDIRVTHHWVREGCAPVENVDRFSQAESQLWTWQRVARGETVVFSNLEDLPPAASRDRKLFQRIGSLSSAVLPLVIAGEPVGWLAFGAVRRARAWTPVVIDQLRLVAETVGSAVARKRADLSLRRAFDFERMIADFTATFVHLPVETTDQQIVQAVGRLGEFLGVDRAQVFQESPEPGLLTRTHKWVREGVPGPPDSERMESFPWVVARVLHARETVVITRLGDLPAEAARDRAELEGLGVRSGALVPLLAEDRVVGFLALTSVGSEQRWSAEMIARLRLVGEVLAGALRRREAELALRSALVENTRLQERLEAENVYLQQEVNEAHDFGDIIGQSAVLRAALGLIDQVAVTDAPVLLLGETGTGKELFARAIHARSPRSAKPLIAINCAALPPTLVESELFGHERGAFTGAIERKAGRFELADGGTLFLDEIGDLDSGLQTKLLRALQEGEIQRLGSTSTRKVDVRIIAATNRDVPRAMRDGQFRSDLIYRLAVFPITLPPLRERPEDIPLLVWHFIESGQRRLGRVIKKVPRAAMDALVVYDWPGNVRELQNVIERALILSPGPVLQIDEALTPAPAVERGTERSSSPESMQEVERAHIVQALQRCHWTIEGPGRAAERLGLRPSTLRNRMKKLGIRRPVR